MYENANIMQLDPGPIWLQCGPRFVYVGIQILSVAPN